METQKILNLLNGCDNENWKLATKKWYVIDSKSKVNYSKDDPIQFLTKSLESSLCDYPEACILVTGNITVKRRNDADIDDVELGFIAQVLFKNCSPFKDCRTEINGTFVDNIDFINIAMPMDNLIEYSDIYSDTSGSLWDFKRDEKVDNEDVTNDNNPPSFKYKASIIGNTENNRTKNGVKAAVRLKYLSSFWISLEMLLISRKVELSLNWTENCVLTTAANANKVVFKITDAKLYVPIVTLSAEDNAKLSKLLSDWFKRTVYWNEYKVIGNEIVEIAANNEEKDIRELLGSSCQGVKRLLDLAYNNKDGDNQVSVDSCKKYFPLRVKIENCNVEIDGRNCDD